MVIEGIYQKITKGVKIEKRPEGLFRRPGMSFELVKQPGFPHRDEYHMSIKYIGHKVGYCLLGKPLDGDYASLSYLSIDDKFRGYGFSIDALDMVNELFQKKWRRKGLLKNEILEENKDDKIDVKMAKYKIYERMGWRMTHNPSGEMVLDLK